MSAAEKLPPLFLLALGMWPSCAASYHLLGNADASILPVLFCVGLVGAAGGSILVMKRFAPCWLLVAVGVLAGMSASSSFAIRLCGQIDAIGRQDAAPLQLSVVEDARSSDFGKSCIATYADPDLGTLRVRVSLSGDAQVRCWDTLSLTAIVKEPSESARRHYWDKGLVGSIAARDVQVQRCAGIAGAVATLRERGIAAFDDDGSTGAVFMRAIIFGDREQLFDTKFYEDVKRVGLSHLVAVSGTHLSIVVGGVALLLGLLRFPARVSVGVQITASLLFVMFTGMSHSALRACVMAVCAVSSLFFRKRRHALNSLSLCIVSFIAVHPPAALSASFTLSALSTLGMVLFARKSQDYFDVLFCGRFKALSASMALTCSVCALSVPVAAMLFGFVSLVSVLANVLVLPVFGVLCLLGNALGLLVALGVLSQPLSYALSYLGEAFAQFTMLLSHVPYAAIPVDMSSAPSAILAFACIAAYLAAIHMPHLRLSQAALAVPLFCVLATMVLFPRLHGTELVMLDVGQGDAILLRQGVQAVLVDTGKNDKALLRALARHSVYHLDAVVLTHSDDDHVGSLPALTQYLEVDNVLVAQDMLVCTCGNCARVRSSNPSAHFVGLHKGDEVGFASYSFAVLWPGSFANGGGNDDSLVILASVAQEPSGEVVFKALLTGDAESEVLHSIAGEGGLCDIDVLKVGHHGSAGACSEELLDALDPDISLISVGSGNRYGHPNKSTVDLLEKGGSRIFRTDLNGDVVCEITGEAVSVHTMQ